MKTQKKLSPPPRTKPALALRSHDRFPGYPEILSWFIPGHPGKCQYSTRTHNTVLVDTVYQQTPYSQSAVHVCLGGSFAEALKFTVTIYEYTHKCCFTFVLAFKI
jgi:hypothetical protein